MNAIAPERLNEVLRYDPESGKLFWRDRGREFFETQRAFSTWNARYAGKEAMTSDNGHGYLRGSIGNKLILAHRAIWALQHGEWPVDQIDHINGDRRDNRISNLRCVSHKTNGRNQKRPTNNRSGAVGVHFYKKSKRWQAHITTEGKTNFLGYFDSFEDAVEARKSAEQKLGFHSNHGRHA